MRIFKYTLDITERQTVSANIARVLSVGEQEQKLVIWAEVYENPTPTNHEFFIFGTGQYISLAGQINCAFVGTVAMKSGFVAHIYHSY